MELNLGKSVEKELNTIAEIYMTEFSKPPYNETWAIAKAVEKMKFFFEFYDLFTIKSDGVIVGFICVNPKFMCPGEVAFGEEIAIRGDFQGKGIGTWVFSEIFKIYKNRRFKRFMGISNVKSKSFNLYKKLGILPSKKDVLIEKEL